MYSAPASQFEGSMNGQPVYRGVDANTGAVGGAGQGLAGGVDWAGLVGQLGKAASSYSSAYSVPSYVAPASPGIPNIESPTLVQPRPATLAYVKQPYA